MKRQSLFPRGLSLPLFLPLLIATAATAAPLLLTNTVFKGTALQFTVMSTVASTNQVQTATNLRSGAWVVLTNLTVLESPFVFTDTISPPAPERFYRIVAINSGVPQPPPGMVLIPAGLFQMGDTFNEGEAYELPVHTVTVSAFFMDQFEVTKGLWDDVMNWGQTNGYAFENAGIGKAATHPVLMINWYDMAKWCNARSEKDGRAPAYFTDAGLTQVYRTGRAEPYVNWSTGYRLPTEAEWEKAARGGTSGHRFPWSDVDTITHSQANYYSDAMYSFDVSLTRGFDPAFDDGVMPFTSPVGSFAPNGYGVYDMAGNAWEWCWDWAGQYPSESQTDPRGPASGTGRVGRGGNWNYYAVHCRCAYRYGDNPSSKVADNIGFRCAMSAR